MERQYVCVRYISPAEHDRQPIMGFQGPLSNTKSQLLSSSQKENQALGTRGTKGQQA